MSSKLLRWDEAKRAAPIEWRMAPGASGQTRRSGPAQSAEANDDAKARYEQALEARIDMARKQGRAEGEAHGAERAAERIEPVLQSFSALVQELQKERPRVHHAAETDAVKLALAIAQRIIHRELATDPEAILGLVKAAFQKLNAREVHKLRVSPFDAAAIQEFRTRLHLPPGLEIVSDASLAGGSSVFETTRGELDASVSTQLSEIERGLTDLMRRRGK